MEEDKKKFNWFKFIIVILFLAYISLYFLNISGYYDGSVRRKVEFTEEQIAKFEADVREGKEVDVEEYLIYKDKDYTNGASKLGFTISSNIEKVMNKGIREFVKILNKLLS